MKLRTYGLTAVLAIFGYAVTKCDAASAPINVANLGSYTASQAVAACGVTLLVAIFVLDQCYFYPLLLGAVSRAEKLEERIDARLTSTISSRVGRGRARSVLWEFYAVALLAGIVIVFILTCKPNPSSMP